MKNAPALLLLILTSIVANAQSARRAGELYPGITIGINSTRLAAETTNGGDVKEVTVVNGLGYRLGLLGGWQMSRRFAIELNPSLAFNDSKLGITRNNLSQEAYGQSLMLECAARGVYKWFWGKSLPFILGGMSYRQPIGDASATVIQMAHGTLAADVGLGIEKHYRHFTLAPEIRYSHGITNMQNIYGINSVKMHAIILSLCLKS
ncbi:MAG: hypothetical protein KF744_06660 [Taibaiella sp.]|nr:hypothetical protein [Taibaiella sp.]